ncbi:MAG: hypothetical protein M1818_005629 [Claussenomyces sp. TS43310]|nr:MAG: hypothetical protein M1818_005629 [Claussenomyces sp. TS43310]
MFVRLAFLLVTAVLASSLNGAVLAEIELAKREEATLATPIVAPPSQYWEGNDGSWSTFEIRIGTPPQTVRVLPATLWQEIWAVYNGTSTLAPCNTTLGVSPDCTASRGDVYNSEHSSTWKTEQEANVGLNEDLGYIGEGIYGFDTVGLGWNNATGIALGHQIVAEIISETYWFGVIGIGFQPTNYTDYDDPQMSFAGTLHSNGNISSQSWSYTAGARYRDKGVFGSLIFGGYDELRFTPNDVVFTMTGDNERNIVPTIRAITSTTSSGNTTLMSTPEFVFIDSSVPEIWLPVNVCQAFETAFGLELDNKTGLYLLNASSHDKLASLNPNITFTLADEKTGGTTVDVVLPYSSFDLNVTAPIYNGTSYYFPLRQAQSEAEYTLGRTFLQEAYLTVSYDNRQFNVSQALFPTGGKQLVIAIPSTLPSATSGPKTSSSTSAIAGPSSSSSSNAKVDSGSHGSKGLSGGEIAGIVLSAIAGLVIIGGVIFCWISGMGPFGRRKRSRSSTPVHEIDTGKRLEPSMSVYTAQNSSHTSEVPGHDAKHEIGGNPIMHPQEMEADVPMTAISHPIDSRVNGVSDSSGKQTNVSSLSQSPRAVAAAMQESGMNPVTEPSPEDSAGSSPQQYVVSPTSPTAPAESVMSRGQPEIASSSPTDSRANWSPDTPAHHQSRFEESLGNPG